MIDEHEEFLAERFDGRRLLIGNGSEIERIIRKNEFVFSLNAGITNNVKWVNREEFDKVSFGTTQESPYEKRTVLGIEAPNMLGIDGGFIVKHLEEVYLNFWAEIASSPLEILKDSMPENEYVDAKYLLSRFETKDTRHFYVIRTRYDNFEESFLSIYDENLLEDKDKNVFQAKHIGLVTVDRPQSKKYVNKWRSKVFMSFLNYEEEMIDTDEIHIYNVLNRSNCLDAWLKNGLIINKVETYYDTHMFYNDFKKYLRKNKLRP